MGKPDALSRHSGEEKSGMDAHLFHEGQLMDLDNDHIGKDMDMEDVELDRINVIIWKKNTGLQVVLQEYKLEVPSQSYDS